MYKITGTIKLISPFLYNKPSPEVIRKLDEHKGGGRPTKAEKIGEAGDKVHTDPKKVLVIPQEMFKRSIIQGAKLANLKWGRRSLSQYLEAVLFVEEPLSFKTKSPDSIFEHWGKIPPRTGAMALIRRPQMNADRTLDFSIVIFDDSITADVVIAALNSAGLYSGLGAWRPQYGRFIVVKCSQQPATPASKKKEK
jgi:hypothetical protein